VSLVPEGEVPVFLEAMRASYYALLIAEGRLTEEEVGTYLFASKPSSGAAILRLKLSGLEGAAEAAQEPAKVAA
jgi:N-acetylgalactosamine kinase